MFFVLRMHKIKMYPSRRTHENTRMTIENALVSDNEKKLLFYRANYIKWELHARQTMHAKMADILQIMQPIAFIGGCIATGLLAKKQGIGMAAFSAAVTAVSPFILSPLQNTTRVHEYQKLRDDVSGLNTLFEMPATRSTADHIKTQLDRVFLVHYRYSCTEPYVFPWLAECLKESNGFETADDTVKGVKPSKKNKGDGEDDDDGDDGDETVLPYF